MSPCGAGRARGRRGRGRGRSVREGEHRGAEGVPAPQQAVELGGGELVAVGAPDLDRELVAAAGMARLLDRARRPRAARPRAASTAATVSRRRRVEPVVGLDGDAQAAHVDRRAGSPSGTGGDAAVAAVGAGDEREQQRDVVDRAGERADLRARVAERADLALVVDHAGDRDAARRSA